MQAIVLAAGYATRLYPLTIDRPKPLLKIGEKTILDYLLARFQQLNIINKVYIVTNEKFSKVFEEWALEINRSGIYSDFQLEIVNDGTTSNETRLGAIADIQFVISAKDINDDVIVAAGDNVFKIPFNGLLEMFMEKQADIFMAHPVERLEKLQRSGVMELNEHQQIIGFEEKPQNPRSNFVAPALYFYKKETLPLIKKFIDEGNNPDAPGNFTAWLYKQKPVYAYIMHQDYFDIGTIDAYNSVCNEMQL